MFIFFLTEKYVNTHIHTLTMAKKASQLWPSGVGLCGKGPNVQNSGFSKHERNFLFFSLQKNRVSQWEVKSFESDSYLFLKELKTKWEKQVVLQKERNCP